MKFRISILVILLAISFNSFAQDNTTTHSSEKIEIKVTDGNRIIGVVEKEDNKSIWIKTDDYGTIQIDKSKIKTRKVLDESRIKDGEYWHKNPNSTRNLYGPTGYGLKKGEGYYQNFYVLLNSVSYGFSDNFTMGAGVLPLFGTGASGFTVTPKFSFPIVENKVNVGAGALYANLAGENI